MAIFVHFAQSKNREDYLAVFVNREAFNVPYEPEPIGRYNVAPGTAPADAFIWHPVTRAVGNVHNQRSELIQPVDER